MEAHIMHHQLKVGTVISDKMDKSISVQVTRHAMHPKYGKRIIKSRKFIVDDPTNAAHVGDRVQIAEGKPMSKLKRWTLVKIVEKAPVLGGSEEE